MIRKRNFIKIVSLVLFFLFSIFFCTTIFQFYLINTRGEFDYSIIEQISDKENQKTLTRLEIPKIHLVKELYEDNPTLNQVNSNILVQEDSVFPGDERSNVILAGHSGTGPHAYFKNLYQLDVGDTLSLYYRHHQYEYEIKEIEFQEKTGTLYIKEEYPNMLTLITCTKNNATLQTIYYAKLEKIDDEKQIF